MTPPREQIAAKASTAVSAPWRSRLSLRWVLPAVIVAPVLAVACVLVLLGHATATQTANDLAGQNMRQIHARIESHLAHLMSLPPAINELNKLRLRDGQMSLGDPQRSRKPVFETLRIFPDVSSIVLGKATGEAMWVIRYPGEKTYEYAIKPAPGAKMNEFTLSASGEQVGGALSAFDYEPSARPWYRAAMEAGGPTWGDVYVWVRNGKGETLGVSYVEPYRGETGEIQGVINCELTLADISAFLSRLKVGKTGKAFIIERNGNLVATSVGLSCMKDGLGRLPAREAGDAQIAAAATELEHRFTPLKTIDGVNRAAVRLAGEPVELVVSPFHHGRNLDWLIVTLVPENDFLAEVRHSRRRALAVATVAVAAALVAGMLLAVWLARPILAVVEHARRVGGGDLDARLVRHDNREMLQLSTALNDMADGLKDRMRLRHALSLAMEVQQSLLPTKRPVVKGVDVAARSKYCDETGGDYYDYLDITGLGPHSLVIALGDVMGHGIAAAMLMATARGILRSHTRVQGSLSELLTHVNKLLVEDTGGRRFMTMFLGVVDTRTHTMRWASAGHDVPLLYDPAGGLTMAQEGGGLPLGVLDSETYEEQTFRGLRPGMVMVVGTDGLWESKNEAGEEFGKRRVSEALAAAAHLDAAAIDAAIYQALQAFCGARANDDDITYVVIKFTDEAETK
ncbi:MAG: SpoIIE family protein phosphatase [Planctomycetes bacterium]|nr:SpoIIE family protein phosphatase [Planctomycetota bacterium]